MKRLILGLLTLSLIFGLSGCIDENKETAVKSEVQKAELPEFDGAYVKLKNGKYIELVLMSTINNTSTCIDNGKVPQTKNININQFEGIAVVGNLHYPSFSLHKGTKTSYGRVCGNKALVAVNARTTPMNGYFKPKEQATEGTYVIWIGHRLWWFKIV